MGLLEKKNRNGQRVLLGALLWVTLAFGLLVQLFASHLKIQNHKFVIPSALIANANAEVHPDELVAQERRVQVLSGILTLCGALGLACFYRRVLMGPLSPGISSKGERDEKA